MKSIENARRLEMLKRGRKSKPGVNIVKSLIKILIWLIALLCILYSAYKYNLLYSFFNTNITFANYANNLTRISEKVFSKGIFDAVPSALSNFISDKDKDIKSNPTSLQYTSENKFWALSYAEPAVSTNASLDSSSTDNTVTSDELAQSTENTKNSNQGIKKQSTANTNLYIMPVEGKIGSKFGDRVQPITNKAEFHKGIDIEAPTGTPIKAFLSGKIISCGRDATFGNYVKIQHDNDLSSVYAHCSKILVKKGQNVSFKEIIGYVGSTGSSTGPHLHFEIHKKNEPLDPLSLISITK